MNGARVGKDLEHNGAGFNRHQLVSEVCLPGIRPVVDIEGLELEEEWPIWLGFFIAMLIPLGPVHD